MSPSKKLVRKLAAGALFCLFAAALFTCQTVPEYCGNGTGKNSWLLPKQFCFGDAAYDLCGGKDYNPLVEGCDKYGNVGTRCLNGSFVPKGTPCGGYTISTAEVPWDGGSITLNPPNTSNYKEGQKVALTAVAAEPNYRFVGWAGAKMSAKELDTLTVGGPNANLPLTAMFTPVDKTGATAFRLITSVMPENGGRITRNPAGTGSGTYDAGTKVTVIAEPGSGYAFTGWAGALTSTLDTATVTMNESKTLVAMFAPAVRPAYTLTVKTIPENGGAVYVNNAAVPNKETVKVDSGTTVAVRAVAAAGQTFTGWSGADTSSAAGLTMTVAGNLTLTANFKKKATADGGKYEYVDIGGLKWMKKNLDIKTAGSRCYGEGGLLGESFDEFGEPTKFKTLSSSEVQDNCDKYGRLYTWEEATKVCPTGWRLPSRDDWTGLVLAIGGSSESAPGRKLKSLSGWDDYCDDYRPCVDGNGTDDFELSAMPGGMGMDTSGTFFYDGVGKVGLWWTATTYDNNNAFRVAIYNDLDRMLLRFWPKRHLYSVRCVTEGTVVPPPPPPPPPPSYEINKCGEDGTDLNCKTATMPDGKTWMTQNLNSAVDSSYCYEDSPDSCAKYGRLYQWEAAMTACPKGWHLPDTTEWDRLLARAGGSSVAGKALKSKSYWYNDGNGTDAYGFSALPGGQRSDVGRFLRAGYGGCWWTANVEPGYWCGNGGCANRRSMDYANDGVDGDIYDVYYSYSVRCIADDPISYGPNNCGANGTDDSCGTLKMPDGKLWMTQNLNYETEEGSWCYGDSAENCEKYGRLYTLEAARSACLTVGNRKWRLPTRTEWEALVNRDGGDLLVGSKLKSKSGWNENNGTDDYEFSAFPGGDRTPGGSFENVGRTGYWWTTTSNSGSSGTYYYRSMHSTNDNVREWYADQNSGFSARCIEN